MIPHQVRGNFALAPGNFPNRACIILSRNWSGLRSPRPCPLRLEYRPNSSRGSKSYSAARRYPKTGDAASRISPAPWNEVLAHVSAIRRRPRQKSPRIWKHYIFRIWPCRTAAQLATRLRGNISSRGSGPNFTARRALLPGIRWDAIWRTRFTLNFMVSKAAKVTGDLSSIIFAAEVN